MPFNTEKTILFSEKMKILKTLLAKIAPNNDIILSLLSSDDVFNNNLLIYFISASACQADDLEMINILDNCFNVDFVDKGYGSERESILYNAVSHNAIKIIKYITEKVNNNDSINREIQNGLVKELIHKESTLENIIKILDYYKYTDTDTRESKEKTLLIEAITNRKFNLVQSFLEYKPSLFDDLPVTLKQIIINFPRIKKIDVLLKKLSISSLSAEFAMDPAKSLGDFFKKVCKKDILDKDKKEFEDFISEIINDKNLLVNLLENEVDMKNLLIFLIKNKFSSVNIIQLLEENVKLMQINFEDKKNLLHVAAELDNLELINYLIEQKGFNPASKNAFDQMPIDLASRENNRDAFKYLIDYINISEFNYPCIHFSHTIWVGDKEIPLEGIFNLSVQYRLFAEDYARYIETSNRDFFDCTDKSKPFIPSLCLNLQSMQKLESLSPTHYTQLLDLSNINFDQEIPDFIKNLTKKIGYSHILKIDLYKDPKKNAYIPVVIFENLSQDLRPKLPALSPKALVELDPKYKDILDYMNNGVIKFLLEKNQFAIGSDLIRELLLVAKPGTYQDLVDFRFKRTPKLIDFKTIYGCMNNENYFLFALTEKVVANMILKKYFNLIKYPKSDDFAAIIKTNQEQAVMLKENYQYLEQKFYEYSKDPKSLCEKLKSKPNLVSCLHSEAIGPQLTNYSALVHNWLGGWKMFIARGNSFKCNVNADPNLLFPVKYKDLLMYSIKPLTELVPEVQGIQKLDFLTCVHDSTLEDGTWTNFGISLNQKLIFLYKMLFELPGLDHIADLEINNIIKTCSINNQEPLSRLNIIIIAIMLTKNQTKKSEFANQDYYQEIEKIAFDKLKQLDNKVNAKIRLSPMKK